MNSTSAPSCNQLLLKTTLPSLSRDDNNSDRQCITFSSAGFGKRSLCIPEVGALHADLERKLKKKREKAKEKGSILTRAGTLEAVFEQGEECSARGRISGGEEERTSAVQGMKGLEKQCGIKLCEICWVGSGLAQ